MIKTNSYSKYQRGIIKAISKELGPNIPFRYEKTSNSHLRVCIDGIDKPMFTSSTPSDCKSAANFMSGIRCALKEAQIKSQVKASAPKYQMVRCLNNAQLKHQQYEALINACVKTVRTNIEQYRDKEKVQLLAENSIHDLKNKRKNLSKIIFEQTKKLNKNSGYLTGKDTRSITTEIFKHLNFMLPNSADYTNELKPKHKLSQAVSIASGNKAVINSEAISNDIEKVQQNTETVTNLVLSINDTAPKLDEKKPKQSSKKTGMTTLEKKVTTSSPAEELAAMNEHQAVQSLRILSRNESEAMLKHIKLAMEMNHQQDLCEVSEVMESKGISLEMMFEYLSCAA